MRFQFYTAELADVPKLSVDGTVDNSIHFSHWEGNETPPELRADTSTEIALNLVSSPKREEFTHGIELVTNNHFDTDGVLSVWTVLNGERALDLRDRLIPAAEAGDFSEFSNEDAVRASIVIQGADQASSNNDTASPLARHLGGDRLIDDALSYDLVLPEVENVLTRTGDYEILWRDAWEQIAVAMESFERGQSTVEEYSDVRLSLIKVASQIFGPAGFSRVRHAAPNMAIARYAKGELFLIAMQAPDGWYYQIDYPYYSWAETVVRPRIPRHDLTALLAQLNQLEAIASNTWKVDHSEMTSAAKCFGDDGLIAASRLAPETIALAIRNELSGKREAGLSGAGA